MDESVIPKGYYCYSGCATGIKYKPCKYWNIYKRLDGERVGICEFLGKTDDDLNGGHLWDQIKECGINHYTDEEVESMMYPLENKQCRIKAQNNSIHS